jgi:hypothetical protein
MKTKIFSHPSISFGYIWKTKTQKSGDFKNFFFQSLLAIETSKKKKKKNQFQFSNFLFAKKFTINKKGLMQIKMPQLLLSIFHRNLPILRNFERFKNVIGVPSQALQIIFEMQKPKGPAKKSAVKKIRFLIAKCVFFFFFFNNF